MLFQQPADSNPLFDDEHPAARFVADCAFQFEVSRSLLACADALPGKLDRTAITYFIKVVPAASVAHALFQSEVAFPLLRRRHEGETISRWLDRLEEEHIELSGVDEELVAQFHAVLNDESVDVEMLGYLMRNASERRRVHVEMEQAILAPLFPAVLAPVERQGFVAWSRAHPWPLNGIER